MSVNFHMVTCSFLGCLWLCPDLIICFIMFLNVCMLKCCGLVKLLLELPIIGLHLSCFIFQSNIYVEFSGLLGTQFRPGIIKQSLGTPGLSYWNLLGWDMKQNSSLKWSTVANAFHRLVASLVALIFSHLPPDWLTNSPPWATKLPHSYISSLLHLCMGVPASLISFFSWSKGLETHFNNFLLDQVTLLFPCSRMGHVCDLDSLTISLVVKIEYGWFQRNAM